MSIRLDKEDLRLVEFRLRKFREEFGIWTAPVDCYRLIRSIQDSGKISLSWETATNVPDYFWGQTSYDSKENQYNILLRQEPVNWKRFSSWRRYNFTVAHELGHIAFRHLETPRAFKSNEIVKFEEAEADAFASRLLMPLEVLGQFCSVREAADALWVSESAIRRRLRDSGLLLAIRTCPRCAFSRIPPAARFCRMCGQDLQDIPSPPPEEEIRYLPPAPEECPVCGYRGPDAPGGICLNCDYPKRNHCLPEYNQPPHRCPDDAKYCEICGSETLYRELFPLLHR